MFVSQSIQRPGGINVFGSCLIRVEPDYASLRFAVTRLAPQPGPAFEQASAGARKVRELLVGEGVAERDVRTSQITLEQAYEGYNEARRFVGYRARVAFQVNLHRLDRFETVVVGVVDAGGDQIENVTFKTSRLRELRDEARKGAVLAAQRKARIYAEAAGASVGPVAHIEDVNADDVSRRSHMADVDLAGHDESPLSGADNPGSIVVAAAVMVCFSLLHGGPRS